MGFSFLGSGGMERAKAFLRGLFADYEGWYSALRRMISLLLRIR